MKTIIHLLLLLLVSTTALAEIHQWVDAHGNTHFGDEPPGNVDSKLLDIEITPTPPAQVSEKSLDPESLREQEQQRMIDEIIEQKLAEKEAEKANEIVKEQKCKNARERLAVLQQSAPAYVDEQGKFRTHWSQDTYQGKRRYISEAQRPTEVEKANNNIIMNCQNPNDEDENNQAYDDWYNEQYCIAARAELERHEKPSSRSSSDTQEEKREAVEKYCK